jgi:hypothetical protein
VGDFCYSVILRGAREYCGSSFKFPSTEMLVFFIHGVATKDVGYPKGLQDLLRWQFMQKNEALPHFHAGFWGAVLKQTGRMWNHVHQDLQELKKNYPQVDVRDAFRYQEFREDFISQFFGDILTYFNTDRGEDIRDTIADQLYKFIKNHPEENELHIVTHSLGSVILWDALFSDRFASDDPAHVIRSLISPSKSLLDDKKLCLRSITTMGSPIMFFNMMLEIAPEKIKAFAAKHQTQPLRWINIIHASDIIAYPLQSSLNAKSIPNLFFRDKFIWADANNVEKTARTFGQAHAAMALSVSDAHCSYWHSRGVARLVAANLIGDCSAIDSGTIDTE